MKYLSILLLGVWISLGTGCTKNQPPPVDSNGNTPQQALIEIYALMINGEYEAAEKRFESDYVESFATKNGNTFEEYCKEVVDGWPVEGLTAMLKGSMRNKDMWSVSIKPDMKGVDPNDPRTFAKNHSLLIIDGEWKIVNWEDHPPKSQVKKPHS